MRALAACALALMLFACAGQGDDQGIALAAYTAAVLSPAPVKQVCLGLSNWTDAQQDQMRVEFDALAPSAILRAVFKDWLAMRDETRACIKAQG